MPRKPRLEFSGALYLISSRGDRDDAIFHDDLDRQDFIRTLAEACVKADFRVHAYSLAPKEFQLVLETLNGNLVSGLRWLLSSYTLRLNRRRNVGGHVFRGRYRAVLVDGGSDAHLKSACEYVLLMPARTGLLSPSDRLLAFPWSSLSWHLAAPEHRPQWMASDRLRSSYGIAEDTESGRKLFERRLEERRQSLAADDAEWSELERGWCFGSDAFRTRMLEMLEGRLGDHHSGALRRESAEAKAERIIAEELRRLGWSESDLAIKLKGDPAKLALANRLRSETILTVKWIAERLCLGTPKSARPRLRKAKRLAEAAPVPPPASSLWPEPTEEENLALL